MSQKDYEELDGELNLSVNKNCLDEEWEKQPELMKDWCITLADATLEFDRAKDFLAEVEAELDGDIRKQPDAYGIGKLTETAIKQAILSSERRKKAAEALYRARHDVNSANAIVNALEHRKRALTCLVDLQLSNYFASSRSSKGRVRGVKEQEDENDDD